MLIELKRALDALGVCEDKFEEMEYINHLIEASTEFIHGYTRKNFLKAEEVEQEVRGANQEKIALRNLPLIEVIECPEFWKTTDCVVYLKSKLDRGSFYKIKYRYGYDEVPADIAQACLELVMWKYKLRSNLDKVSIADNGATVQFQVSSIPPFIKVMLDNYRGTFL